jgi:C-terminal peptidase prc
VFDRAWGLVRDRYLYEDYGGLNWGEVRERYRPQALAASEPEAFYDLVSQMIDELGDDHSRFENPQQVAEDEAEFNGSLSYAGIGAQIRETDEGGFVVRLAANGPAEQAGLRHGDLVLAVAGTPFTDTASFGAMGPIGAVRGAAGTSVVLLVRSPGEEPRDVRVVRRVILADAYPDVEGQRLPGGNVGFVAINTFFAEGLPDTVRREIEELARAGPLEGLIVDVRDNGGGQIHLLLETLALLLDGGTIGSSAGRNDSEELEVPAGQMLPELSGVPVVVLTGEDTVSAAEMFAAGLQARGRARVVGLPSAGNTENLSGYDFDDGSRLWLAEYAFRLPDGSQIEGRGVQPDRVVDAEWWRFLPPDDPQVRAALAELGANSVTAPGQKE